MAGVEGLGRRVMAGFRGPQAAHLAASLDQLGLQVTPENVLQVRKALLVEARRLGGLLGQYRPTIQLLPPGGDPVSGPATDGLNEKLHALTGQYEMEVKALNDAGAALEATARSYGITEEQIRDSLRMIQPRPQGQEPGEGWAPSD